MAGRRRSALAALPVALGLLLAGPAVGTAAASPSSDASAGQARHCLLLCAGHHHHHGHIHVLGLHLGLWLHL